MPAAGRKTRIPWCVSLRAQDIRLMQLQDEFLREGDKPSPDLKLHRFLENGPGKRERMKFAIFTARVNVGRQ
jgi:hypothetical protein